MNAGLIVIAAIVVSVIVWLLVCIESHAGSWRKFFFGIAVIGMAGCTALTVVAAINVYNIAAMMRNDPSGDKTYRYLDSRGAAIMDPASFGEMWSDRPQRELFVLSFEEAAHRAQIEQWFIIMVVLGIVALLLRPIHVEISPGAKSD